MYCPHCSNTFTTQHSSRAWKCGQTIPNIVSHGQPAFSLLYWVGGNDPTQKGKTGLAMRDYTKYIHIDTNSCQYTNTSYFYIEYSVHSLSHCHCELVICLFNQSKMTCLNRSRSRSASNLCRPSLKRYIKSIQRAHVHTQTLLYSMHMHNSCNTWRVCQGLRVYI